MSSLPQPRKRWRIREPIPSDALAELGDLSPLLAQLLYNRGIRARSEAAAFLSGRWEGPSPFALKGMAEAVARIYRAIRHGEPVAVYGDFDTDGITATALLTETLRGLGAEVRAYFPDRFNEGYGLNQQALERLYQAGYRLVVTADCGIRSATEVKAAQAQGMDVIITDHHFPGQILPPARAIVNPKQLGCPYPFKDLSGVGVAFKLAQALLQDEDQPPAGPRGGAAHGRASLPNPADLLDLVALGTVADIVPLVGENRSLASQGLALLNELRRPGLRALVEKAGLQPGGITATHISFILAPRLNAAGRIAAASLGYQLLTTEHAAIANDLAEKLEMLNLERQRLTRETFQKAQADLAETGALDRPLLMVSRKGFHPGIVGLVASRLTEEYYRPSVVVEVGEDFSKGSARSIPEFHITQALDRCADLLVRHGGHAAAAGFTCANEQLPALEERLLSIAEEILGGQELAPTLEIEAEIPLSAAPDALRALRSLEPVGESNPLPCFLTRGVRVNKAQVVGKEGQHLRLELYDGCATWDGIGFNLGSWAADIPGQIDVVYHLEQNQWGGEDRIRLSVQDLRPAAEGAPTSSPRPG
ncbi:MAG: single-stranded-DNA-specific exonuclease RecJ [Anaerolineae bacterium]